MPSFQIPELLILILEHLSLRDLITASHVDRQWRALVPEIHSPTRMRLLKLAFTVSDEHPVSLAHRLPYVEEIENTHTIIIPEPYRTILTEWPVSTPPPGMHWPHAVRFHAEGFCSCAGAPWGCTCDDDSVYNLKLFLPGPFLDKIMAGATTIDTTWTDEPRAHLFDAPPRMHTPQQQSQTVALIRAHPTPEYRWTEVTSGMQVHKFRALRLSRYYYTLDGAWADGTFVMLLDGPVRGQIHAWRTFSKTYHDGFEAVDFWEWRYTSAQLEKGFARY